jgi:hypothetical protein
MTTSYWRKQAAPLIAQVIKAAGDGEEAFFRHDDCHQAILGE